LLAEFAAASSANHQDAGAAGGSFAEIPSLVSAWAAAKTESSVHFEFRRTRESGLEVNYGELRVGDCDCLNKT
jgi:hypothetical protein